MSLHVQFVGFDHPYHVSGVSTWLQRTVPRLRELGIDARVDLFCDEPGMTAEWLRSKGVPLRFAKPVGDTRTTTAQCLRWLREDLPSVYVPNCVLPAYFAAAEARRCGVRTVGVMHSDEPFYWGLADEFLRGRDEWRLTDMVVVSDFLKESLKAAAAAAGISLHRIPCGVPVPSATATRSTGVVRMVYTGRLDEEQKRISEVALALCRAARQHTNLEAWIVGAGRDEGNARAVIEKEGMQNRVILKGRVRPSEIHVLLEQCHIHVLLSDYEGLPLSLLEAMAVGLVPVYLDTRSGIREVVTHMQNGIIVGDRGRSFMDAVAFLVNNADAWRSMSAAARQTVIDRFTDEQCARHWKDILSDRPQAPLTAKRPAAALRLPPRNPIFGQRDSRYSPVQRSWYFVRRNLGTAKRRTLQLLRGPSGT